MEDEVHFGESILDLARHGISKDRLPKLLVIVEVGRSAHESDVVNDVVGA